MRTVLSLGRCAPFGLLLAGIAVVLVWPDGDDRRGPAPSAQSPSPAGYVVPPWWDGYSSAEQDFYLAWDLLVWQVEQTCPPVATPTVAAPFNVVATAIRDVMLQPGCDDLKRRLATFVSVGHRPHYLPYLAVGLDPTRSAVKTRVHIAGALRALLASQGAAPFTAEVRAGLVQAYQVESHPYVAGVLHRLLTSLQEPH